MFNSTPKPPPKATEHLSREALRDKQNRPIDVKLFT